MKQKIVLAYSGGLDTSVILRWLQEKCGMDVIAYTADLGQGEDLARIKKKALALGAVKVYVDDLKEEFVKDYVYPAIQANAVYESGYLLGTSLARPLIAKHQVEIAKKEKASCVAHGATGKGNDQVRFELTYMALAPHLKIIAPWREWAMKSRTELIGYARKHNIPIPVTKQKPYSTDSNLFHISYEGGILEDPWAEPPEDIFQMTISPQKAPDKPEYIEIEFVKGIPVSKQSPARFLDRLNKIAGRHGIGRIDIVENRFVGMKSRGIYETPGGTVLHIAHRAIESITMDREVMRIRDQLIPKFSELIYYGFWFSPEMDLLRKTIADTQRNVTGTVRLKLYKGTYTVVGRKSPVSLYKPAYATFEKDTVYNQKDAEGFIRLNALRLKLATKTPRHFVP